MPSTEYLITMLIAIGVNLLIWSVLSRRLDLTRMARPHVFFLTILVATGWYSVYGSAMTPTDANDSTIAMILVMGMLAVMMIGAAFLTNLNHRKIGAPSDSRSFRVAFMIMLAISFSGSFLVLNVARLLGVRPF